MSSYPEKCSPLAETTQIKILINLTPAPKQEERLLLSEKRILKMEHHVNDDLIFLFIEHPLSLVERKKSQSIPLTKTSNLQEAMLLHVEKPNIKIHIWEEVHTYLTQSLTCSHAHTHHLLTAALVNGPKRYE